MGSRKTQREAFLTDQLLRLRGWAGMTWQMETNAEWAVRPAPRGTLVEYMAVRLLLLELAQQHQQNDRHSRDVERRDEVPDSLRRAFLVFQIAQVRGWSAADLLRLSPAEWSLLLGEIDAFSSRKRRRIYHQAFERHYRDKTLNAIRCRAREVAAPSQDG